MIKVALSRFLPFGFALLLTAFCAAAVDLGLSLAVGPIGTRMPHGESAADMSVLTLAGDRLAGVISSDKKDKPPPERPLGVFLGQSTLQCGLDSKLLERIDGLDVRWLNLHGQGGTIHRIADIDRLLEESRLDPSFVVFAINPYMLAGTPQSLVRKAESTRGANRIKPWIWAWENRSLVNYLFRRKMFFARDDMLRRLGVRFGAEFSPASDPWKADPKAPTHFMNQKELDARLAYNHLIGWFDPSRYSETSTNFVELNRLLAYHLALGRKAMIILLPDRSMTRKELPAVALDLFRRLDPRVPVVDLADALDDKLFIDLDHLGPDGRVRSTELIADRIKAWLSLGDASNPQPQPRNAAR